MNRGYVHIYTGNGKGKTTAAFGLALRALCSGRSVYVAQFVKSMKYNETRLEELTADADRSFGRIRIEQLGSGCFIGRDPAEEDKEMARKGLEHCAGILKESPYEIVILDELNIALHFGLLRTEDVLKVLSCRDLSKEVVITGRYAPEALIAAADLVTEMKEIRHYYQQGVLSRDGIDR